MTEKARRELAEKEKKLKKALKDILPGKVSEKEANLMTQAAVDKILGTNEAERSGFDLLDQVVQPKAATTVNTPKAAPKEDTKPTPSYIPPEPAINNVSADAVNPVRTKGGSSVAIAQKILKLLQKQNKELARSNKRQKKEFNEISELRTKRHEEIIDALLGKGKLKSGMEKKPEFKGKAKKEVSKKTSKTTSTPSPKGGGAPKSAPKGGGGGAPKGGGTPKPSTAGKAPSAPSFGKAAAAATGGAVAAGVGVAAAGYGVSKLLGFIAGKESKGSYNTIYGGKQVPELTNMTLNQVMEAQKKRTLPFGKGSSAAGKYQMMPYVIAEEAKAAGLNPDKDKFSPENQDKMMLARLKRKRGLDDFLSGKISKQQFGNNLAMEFASMPLLSDVKGKKRGQSYYAGDGLNKALVSPEQVEAALDEMKAGGGDNQVKTETGVPVGTGSGGKLISGGESKALELGASAVGDPSKIKSLVTLNDSSVDVDGLNKVFKGKFSGMADEYREKTGKKIQVNSGFRSMEKQAELYQKMGPGKAARPGNSMHNYGLAIDINSTDGNKLESMGLLKKYGFNRPLSHEKWHVQLAGVTKGNMANLSDGPENVKNIPNSGDKIASTSADNAAMKKTKGAGGSGTNVINVNTTNVQNNQQVLAPPKKDGAAYLGRA